MSRDVFEKLAEWEVPPAPEQFERRVHERINESLIASHLAEFVLGALPRTAATLADGVGHLLWAMLGGQAVPRKRGGDDPPGTGSAG